MLPASGPRSASRAAPAVVASTRASTRSSAPSRLATTSRRAPATPLTSPRRRAAAGTSIAKPSVRPTGSASAAACPSVTESCSGVGGEVSVTSAAGPSFTQSTAVPELPERSSSVFSPRLSAPAAIDTRTIVHAPSAARSPPPISCVFKKTCSRPRCAPRTRTASTCAAVPSEGRASLALVPGMIIALAPATTRSSPVLVSQPPSVYLAPPGTP